MPSEDERRELVPVIIAAIVAAIGGFCLWSDLKNDSLGRGDGIITSAVVSRAGAIMTPSEPPAPLFGPRACWLYVFLPPPRRYITPYRAQATCARADVLPPEGLRGSRLDRRMA